MNINDDVRKCIVYIGYKKEDYFQPCGTGFLVGVNLDNSKLAIYTVTARHVIEGIIKMTAGTNPHIRCNLKESSYITLECQKERWVYHENGLVDIAVASMGLPSTFDHVVFPIDRFLNSEKIAENNIGVGSDTFITGFFKNHYGKEKNIPIVRTGSLAAMREEPIETKLGAIDAYLVEVRSIGGLSGSPVFVHLGSTRIKEGSLQFSQDPHNAFSLLGLVHGHYQHETLTIAEESINTGISIIVPAEKVLEILNSEHFTAERANLLEKISTP